MIDFPNRLTCLRCHGRAVPQTSLCAECDEALRRLLRNWGEE